MSESCREPVGEKVRVLLVEDDRTLARGIAAALAQSGYAVETAGTAREALKLARADDFLLAILDLGLPDRDGFDLLQELRRAGYIFPILILSARGALNDRIRGLDLGADDYLVKPFAIGELEARLRALSRRRDEHAGARRFGKLHYDVAGRQVTVEGEVVDLTARELAILEVLLARAMRIVSKQALFDAVFPLETDAAPNALEVHVSRLRQKLRGAGVTIRSVRGLGYRLEEHKDDGRSA